MANSLDRSSWEPLYSQIAERIRLSIEQELHPGEQIPSENDLIQVYHVSRNTVRLAIEALVKQGLVYRIRGKGTFVAPERLQYGFFKLVSFTEEILRLGMRPSSHLLSLTRLPPAQHIADALCLEPGEEVFLVERLRLANGRPMALNSSHLPCRLCPGLEQEDLEAGSIYQTIEQKYRLRIGSANQTLKPVAAAPVEAELLQVNVGSPLLLVEGVALLTDGTPIEYARLLYRGDSYEFPIRAVRQAVSVPAQELNTASRALY